MKKCIISQKAPKAIGPYSHAVIMGNIVATSGQLPIDTLTGNIVAGDVKEQTSKAIDNLIIVLNECGATLADVVKTTVYIKDMNQFALINEVYAKYFTSNYPARTCVEVARLPKDALVEIEAMAYISK